VRRQGGGKPPKEGKVRGRVEARKEESKGRKGRKEQRKGRLRLGSIPQERKDSSGKEESLRKGRKEGKERKGKEGRKERKGRMNEWMNE